MSSTLMVRKRIFPRIFPLIFQIPGSGAVSVLYLLCRQENLLVLLQYQRRQINPLTHVTEVMVAEGMSEYSTAMAITRLLEDKVHYVVT